MRSQENPDIFREKRPATGSPKQQPRHCYGARMAFYRIPTEFLSVILCALTTLSQCMHCAFTVSLCWRCVKDAVTSQRMLQISMQTPQTTMAFAQGLLWAPAELLLHWRRPNCMAVETLRQSHCDLIRMQAFVLRILKVCPRTEFYAILHPPLVLQWSLPSYWSSASWRSAFFIDAVGTLL